VAVPAHRYGEVCDGLVCQADAIIPHAARIVLDDMDHFGPAWPAFPATDHYDPARLWLVCISMTLTSASSPHSLTSAASPNSRLSSAQTEHADPPAAWAPTVHKGRTRPPQGPWLPPSLLLPSTPNFDACDDGAGDVEAVESTPLDHAPELRRHDTPEQYHDAAEYSSANTSPEYPATPAVD
jgi:hypothetical protein